MSKKNGKIISAVVLVAVVVFLCSFAWKSETGSSDSIIVNGGYQVYVEGEENPACITFDAGTMTYVTEMTSGEEVSTIDSGSYTVEDGVIYTFSETDDANSLEYTIDGDWVVAVE